MIKRKNKNRRKGTSVGVNAELETERMYVVRDRLDAIWKGDGIRIDSAV